MLFELTKRYLKREKRNSIAIIVVAVLSMILISSCFTLKEQDYLEKRKVFYEKNTDYNVMLETNVKSAYETIKSDEDLKDVAVSAQNEVNIGDKSYLSETFDKEYLNKLIKVDMATGRLPESKDEVSISRRYMTVMKDFIKNDEIVIDGRKLKVVGTYDAKAESKSDLAFIQVNSADEIIKNSENVMYYADYPTNGLVGMQVMGDDGLTYDRSVYNKTFDLLSKINSTHDKYCEMRIVSENEIEKSTSVVSMVSGLSKSTLSIIIALFTMFAMKNAFSMSTISKVKYLGTLKAIGAEPDQIKKLINYEVGILFLISYPLGLALGLIVSKITGVFTTNLLGYESYSISLTSILNIVSLGFSVLLFSMYVASSEARNIAKKLTAVEAMTSSKGYKSEGEDTGVNSEFINKNCNIEIILADKNVSNNANKYRMSFLTLAVAMLLLTFMINKLSISYENAERKYILSTNWNVEISNMKGFSNSEIKEIKDIVGEGYVFKKNIEDSKIKVPDDRISYDLKSEGILDEIMMGNELEYKVDVISGNEDMFNKSKEYIESGEINYNDFSENDIILVNNSQIQGRSLNRNSAPVYKYLEITNYKAGDKIKLSNGKEYNIKAVINENPIDNLIAVDNDRDQLWKMAVITSDKYEKNLTDTVLISVNKDNQDEIMEKVNKLAKEKSYSVYNRFEKTNESAQLNAKYSWIDIIFTADIILILVISLINTLTTIVVTRKSEIAALRAIGMSKKQVKKNVVSEGVIVCIYAGIIGATLSMIFLALRGNSFLNQGKIKYDLIIAVVIGAFIAQLIIGIISAIKPLKNIITRSVVDDIRS